MKYFISITAIVFTLNGCLPQGTPGPEGPPGQDGQKGEQGLQGEQGQKGEKGSAGVAGKSVPADQLQKLDKFLSNQNGRHKESVVGIESYSFGLAPRVTGFCYLTNNGRIFKLENKNTQVLGDSFIFVVDISNQTDFISLSRIAYGDDIKQYFSAVTESGLVFTSQDLKSWTSQGSIPLD